MNLGQLLSGTDAVKAYQKGTQLIERQIQLTHNQKELSDLKRQLVSGLTSIAEIYMTDLCFEPDAEQLCELWTSKALNVDPNNWEALQTYGSLCISKQRKQDALDALKKCYQLIEQLDSNDAHWPSREAQTSLGKLLIEVEDHQTASRVFEVLIEEYESDPEMWYLAGYCYMHFDLDSASRCLEAAKSLLSTDADPDSYQSVTALLEEVNQKRANK
ncbi:uncharacterized protein LOC126326536 [Schistocerca gregaria]|uniref:uncharacterized protein LOC126326536 n=1 Tax=Schistocerca gregaria TaxID=7010 RepID=UPI00211ECC60|nr:uncharacterized protein LOC126326536 [Schistocerca gregaria]